MAAISHTKTLRLQPIIHAQCGCMCTFTEPSLLAVAMKSPSSEYLASFTKAVCPRNSFSVLPDFSPWIL